MNIFQALFKTSIGKKWIMALTGLVLVGFVIGHLIGNLQIFAPPEAINAYAYFLQNLGPALWAVRLFLLVCVVLHVWMAVLLTIENRRARPNRYEAENVIQASYASRTMRISGFIVLAFILFHLAHFTVQVTHPEYRELTATIVYQGQEIEVHDVYSMIVLGFQNIWVSLFYIVAIGLLSLHLSHGISSMFQSLGLKSKRLTGVLQGVAIYGSIAYFLGNLAIPLSVLVGFVTLPS